MKALEYQSDQEPGIVSVFSWLLNGALFRPIADFLSSMVIVAGPWLLSILTLAIISISMEPVLGRAAVEDLRLTIIYSLCVAPLVVAPVGAVSARLVRRLVDEHDEELVPGVFLTSLIISGGLTLFIAILVCLGLKISDPETALAFIFLTGLTSLLWCSLAILAALRAYGFLIGSFSAGMAACIVLVLTSAGTGSNGHGLIWAFSSGIAFCIALILARITGGSFDKENDLANAATILIDDLRAHSFLMLGILFAFCGIWIDKWVHWAGPQGSKSLSGFLHFGSYDSVMFFAHLSIIPAFTAMHILHDGEITAAIRRFRQTLNRNANYALIREAVEETGSRIWNGILVIVFVQATLTATLVLTAPIISQIMGFDFAQFLTLRVGLVAVFLHSIFYMISAVLVVCGCHRLFFAAQAVFFVSNLTFSSILMTLVGPSAYGVFAASLLAAIVTFVVAFRSLHRFDYLVLVGENDSLFAGAD